MTGPRMMVLALVAGALRVPSEAILGPGAQEALDEIVKVGAAVGVLYSAWRYLLRPIGALTIAKVNQTRAVTEAIRQLPQSRLHDDKRHDEILKWMKRVDARLERGAAHMVRDRASIEEVRQHLDLPNSDAD